MKRKVLVVDTHPIVRAGLVHVIANEHDLLVRDEANDGSLAMKELDARKPDVIILKVFLIGCDGIEFIKSLKATSSDLPILVFSIHAPRAARRRPRLLDEARADRENFDRFTTSARRRSLPEREYVPQNAGRICRRPNRIISYGSID